MQRMLTEKWSGENRTNRTAGYGPWVVHKIIWGDNVICRSVPVVRFLAQSRKPDPHAQGGSGLRDYLVVLGLQNRGLQPPQPPPWIRPCVVCIYINTFSDDYEWMQTVSLLERAFCLPPPPGTPHKIYHLMIQCWSVTHTRTHAHTHTHTLISHSL